MDKFSQDVQCMLGSKPGLYWRICWKFISPTFIIVRFFCLTISQLYFNKMLVFKGVVMFGLIYHQPLQYNDYNYPTWAEWVGWGLALSSILMIPLVAIIQLIKTPGTFREVSIVVKYVGHVKKSKYIFVTFHYFY